MNGGPESRNRVQAGGGTGPFDLGFRVHFDFFLQKRVRADF